MSVWILALAAAFFFGVALVLAQFGLRHRSPLGGAAISVPTAALFFVILSPFLIDFSSFDGHAFVVFAAIGLLFPGAVTLLTFAGNVHMGPNVTGAIGNLAPLFAVLLAVTLFGETFGAVQALGIGVIVAGVSLLTLSRSKTATAWPLWAVLLPLSGAAIRGVIQPGIKWGLTLWPDPFAAVTTGYVMSALLILIVAYHRGRGQQSANDAGWTQIGGTQVGGARAGFFWFVSVGLSNGAAVFLTYAALAAGKVTLVSPLIATYPLVTLILSAVILRSAHWTIQMVIGIVATVAGVVIILGGG